MEENAIITWWGEYLKKELYEGERAELTEEAKLITTFCYRRHTTDMGSIFRAYKFEGLSKGVGVQTNIVYDSACSLK